tara:strand:+ start:6242 stop:8647 length:2406 start_codon:yes stop_codon:yes gene_type:complete
MTSAPSPSEQFGRSLPRKEDADLLRGAGRFIDDIVLPDMCVAAFVRSTFAHAKIENINTDAAAALPGVVAVVTYDNLPAALRDRQLPLFLPHPTLTVRMPTTLPRDEVCYVGEPVAMVIAEDRYIAEDAVQLVEVDYMPLPAASDLAVSATPGSPCAHDGLDDNYASRMTSRVGDIELAFMKADHVFAERISQHRGGPFFMECRGAIADYRSAGNSLVFHVASQGSHRQKRALLEMFDFSDSEVRVITPDVGGGFGPKGHFYAEYPAIIAGSMMVGRPVKFIEDRRENFVATHQERDQIWDVEIAVDADARILGLRGSLLHDNGAYTPWGIVLPWISVTTLPGPYKLPAYEMELRSIFTNKVNCTPVRGAGRPEAAVVMERLMDRVAREMGLDPAEVRRRNFITPDLMPYNAGVTFRDGQPVIYDSGDYPACQQAALDAIDYAGFPERKKRARAEGRHIGIGIGNAVEATGLGPYEGGRVKVATNGRITVYTGATPQGQAHKTTLAQIAADHFGVAIDAVEVVTGDTDGISNGIGTFAARTAVNAGSSVHLAAQAVATKAKEVAARELDVPVDQLVLRDGMVTIASADDSAADQDVSGRHNMERVSISLGELAVIASGAPGMAASENFEPGLEHTSYFTPARSTYANGTAVTEVEVDIETGYVKILRLILAHDCGRVINPLVVDGQVYGGIAHAIGNALFEQLLFDESGQPLTTNFGEYLLPVASDVPRMELVHLESPSPLNPLGIKGAGEAGTIPTIASIVAAVEDALAEYGVRVCEAPITPPRIVELLGDNARGQFQQS